MDADAQGSRKTALFRRWVLRLLGGALVLYIVANLAFYLFARAARSRWEELEAELRARREPLTYNEILAGRPVAEEDESPAMRRLLDQLQADAEAGELTRIFRLGSKCKDDFFEGISRPCIEANQRYFASRRAFVEDLVNTESPARPMRGSENGLSSDAWRPRLEFNSRLRQVSDFVSFCVSAQTILGDVPSALNGISLQLRLSEPLYSEPDLLYFLVAIAIDAAAARSVENLLRTHELGLEQLEKLDRIWSGLGAAKDFHFVLRKERALFIETTDTDSLVQSASRTDARAWLDWSFYFPFYDDWMLVANRISAVKALSRMMSSANDPRQLLMASNAELAQMPRFAPGQQFWRIILPSLARSIELHVRLVGIIHATRAAIAAEQFRLAQGRFPERLEELVPEFLDEVPLDPFDGTPLRIRPIEQGIVIYTIGDDGADNGGDVGWIKPPGNRDYGVRLLEPAARGIKIVDDSDPE